MSSHRSRSQVADVVLPLHATSGAIQGSLCSTLQICLELPGDGCGQSSIQCCCMFRLILTKTLLGSLLSKQWKDAKFQGETSGAPPTDALSQLSPSGSCDLHESPFGRGHGVELVVRAFLLCVGVRLQRAISSISRASATGTPYQWQLLARNAFARRRDEKWRCRTSPSQRPRRRGRRRGRRRFPQPSAVDSSCGGFRKTWTS